MRRFHSFVGQLAVLGVCALALAAFGFGQTVTTTAGGYVGDGGPATSAAIIFPHGLARDSSGNIYVSDVYGQRIRKITRAGKISTYAGTGISGYNGDGMVASKTQISYPSGLTFDPAGNLVFADGGNSRVRKIDRTTTLVSTIAGDGTFGYTGDGGPATSAELGQPWELLYDSSKNLYISDVGDNVVRIVNSGGTINTFAGDGVAGFSGDGGPAIKAELNIPSGLAIDAGKNVYIADRLNHRVRKVDTTGTITTFAGDGNTGYSGDGGPATSAAIGNPRGLKVKSGTLYISNSGRSRVRNVVLNTQIINTYAGSFTGYDGDGHSLTSSQFFGGSALFFDRTGNLFLNDSFNGRVRKAVSGNMMTLGGGYLGDTKVATSAALYVPEAVAFDKHGNYFIADYAGNRVRKVSATGKITTVAGTGVSGYSGDGGPATSAMLYFPAGVVVDSNLNLYIADQANNVIRKVDTAGKISTFATYANWSSLGAMAVDTANNLFVVDQFTCAAYTISPAGAVSLFAGVEFTCGYNGDNIPATTAELNTPYGIAIDSSGNVYIADSSNNRIRKVDSTGKIFTTAGNGTCGFSGDHGPPTSAELCFPEGVVLNHNITYIADTFNVRIRKIQSNVITTIAGTGISGYNGDGLPALSTNLDDPVAITSNAKGTVYELDDAQARVRKIK